MVRRVQRHPRHRGRAQDRRPARRPHAQQACPRTCSLAIKEFPVLGTVYRSSTADDRRGPLMADPEPTLRGRRARARARPSTGRSSRRSTGRGASPASAPTPYRAWEDFERWFELVLAFEDGDRGARASSTRSPRATRTSSEAWDNDVYLTELCRLGSSAAPVRRRRGPRPSRRAGTTTPSSRCWDAVTAATGSFDGEPREDFEEQWSSNQAYAWVWESVTSASRRCFDGGAQNARATSRTAGPPRRPSEGGERPWHSTDWSVPERRARHRHRGSWRHRLASRGRPGGGNFLYAFNSLAAVRAAVALFANLVDFAPMPKGGSIRGCIQRGPERRPHRASAPFFFLCCQGNVGQRHRLPARPVRRRPAPDRAPQGHGVGGHPRTRTGPNVLLAVGRELRPGHLAAPAARRDREPERRRGAQGLRERPGRAPARRPRPSWQPVAGMAEFIDDNTGHQQRLAAAHLRPRRLRRRWSRTSRGRSFFDHLELSEADLMELDAFTSRLGLGQVRHPAG
ncbi:MAG: hypothetical protein MZV63_31835 [Marinilabiliales bacterium]|nr:hypothetical protein [Marinilabiliales bacterium]